jgi:hypothetical protein
MAASKATSKAFLGALVATGLRVFGIGARQKLQKFKKYP